MLGSEMVKTIVNLFTSKRHISCLPLLKELVELFISGPVSVLQILNFLVYLKMLFGSSWIFVSAAFSSKSFSSRCFSNITNCGLISGAGFEDFTSFNIFLIMIFLS